MCIAIVCKQGAILDSARLQAGFKSNPDGGGFAYVNPETNKVVIQKGFMRVEALEAAYHKAAAEFSDKSPFLLHMRIGTSGHRNQANTHPFRIKNGAMIHNGTFFTPTGKHVGPENDRFSDTRVFCQVLHNILDYETTKKAEKGILNAVGQYNKLAFLYDDGRYLILNEDSGDWNGEIWFSNSYSCRLR